MTRLFFKVISKALFFIYFSIYYFIAFIVIESRVIDIYSLLSNLGIYNYLKILFYLLFFSILIINAIMIIKIIFNKNIKLLSIIFYIMHSLMCILYYTYFANIYLIGYSLLIISIIIFIVLNIIYNKVCYC